MNTNTTTAALAVELTPAQVKGLKLAKAGDLHPQGENRWTHLDAKDTYAKSDRFKERPIKAKFATTATVGQLREFGLVRELDAPDSASKSAHGITMAGKMWLLKHK